MEVSSVPDLTDSFRGIFDDLRGREKSEVHLQSLNWRRSESPTLTQGGSLPHRPTASAFSSGELCKAACSTGEHRVVRNIFF